MPKLCFFFSISLERSKFLKGNRLFQLSSSDLFPVISLASTENELLSWLRLLALSKDSFYYCWASTFWHSGHIPCPGAVYFLFHSAWTGHVNFSGPNSLFIQIHSKNSSGTLHAHGLFLFWLIQTSLWLGLSWNRVICIESVSLSG